LAKLEVYYLGTEFMKLSFSLLRPIISNLKHSKQYKNYWFYNSSEKLFHWLSKTVKILKTTWA